MWLWVTEAYFARSARDVSDLEMREKLKKLCLDVSCASFAPQPS